MKKIIFQLLFFAGIALCAAEYEIKIDSTSKTGRVKAGEKVQVKAAVFCDGKPISAGYMLRVYQWKDGTKNRFLNVPAEKGHTVKLSLEKPGWSYVSFQLFDSNKKPLSLKRGKRNVRVVGTGIILDPEKLTPVRPEPKDFDAFWNANKAELAKTPLKVIMKKEVPSPKSHIFYDVRLTCAGPKPVSGYLTVPRNSKGRKYPVVLVVDGAGVRDSGKSHYGNAVTFSINAHGIPNGQPKKFYDDLAKGALKGYTAFGRENRNTIYFRYMFIRVLRALEYVKTLPEWNGKDIIVRGSSQGGAQTLFAAAMDKDVTLAVPTVPAMCDFAGCLSKPTRMSGWPRPYDASAKNAKRRAEWDYYDCVNFARRITCPVYVSTGLIDATCSPTSVYTMFNQLKAKEKKIEFHRNMGHEGRNDIGQKAFMDYLARVSKKK